MKSIGEDCQRWRSPWDYQCDEDEEVESQWLFGHRDI